MPQPSPPALRQRGTVPAMETSRLVLRLVSASDVDAVHGYLSREDVCRYLLHPPLHRDEVADRLAADEKRTRLADDGDSLRLAAVRRDDGVQIGEVLLSVVSVAAATLEIGWIFSPDVAGRGYATEAARELMRYAFADLGAHRVIARLHPANTASARLCERLVMRHEALHRADIWVKGGWEDTSVYAILRHE